MFPLPMQRLVRELSRLPSIGEKSATRLAYHLVSQNKDLAMALSQSLREAASAVNQCERCFFLAEGPLCTICKNPSREPGVLCVVEKPMDVVAIERSGDFRGFYHVLHGLWAPLRGRGPESIKLNELVERLRKGEVKEVILGLGATVEGDATSIYLARLISDLGVKATRLAQGISKGADLEYADDLTLSRALAGRRAVEL